MSEQEVGGAPDTETRGERISYWAIATVSWLAHRLPTRTGRMLFAWAGAIAYHLASGPRGVVAANQARVLGRPVGDPMVVASTKEAFRLYGRYWFDAFHVVDWTDERMRRDFVFEGLEHVRAALEAGRGVLCVLPHMGNWDAGGRAMVAQGFETVTVAEEVRPRRLFELFLRERESFGVEVIGLRDGGRVGRRLATSLAANKVVALVADRDLTGRGIPVEMFGAPRRLPAGPALLALSSGAPILVCGVYQRAEGWRCVIGPLPDVARTGEKRRDVEAITAAMAAAFEDIISAAPPDWHMFQPAWEE